MILVCRKYGLIQWKIKIMKNGRITLKDLMINLVFYDTKKYPSVLHITINYDLK